jgi:hypothetical protein
MLYDLEVSKPLHLCMLEYTIHLKQECFLMCLTSIEFSGLGAILHRSWLPGITSTVSASGRGISTSSPEPWTTAHMYLALFNQGVNIGTRVSLTRELCIYNFIKYIQKLMQENERSTPLKLFYLKL